MHPPCRLIIRARSSTGRTSYEVYAGDALIKRTHSETEVRDLIRDADRQCTAEGLELVVDVVGLDPAVIAVWRAPLKPPAE
jgi:hypothetical protein